MFALLARRYGAEEALRDDIVLPTVPRPRNVTASVAEINSMLRIASPALRCFILLCRDTAIRSGTAARLAPQNYERESGTLQFRSKHGSAVIVPVTSELRDLLDTCTDERPFIDQLPRYRHWRSGRWAANRSTSHFDYTQAFQNARRDAGIKRRFTPHDLRRTQARAVYKTTNDMRLAQSLLGHHHLHSTMWYLQDATQEVSASMLELAKLPPATERPQ